MMTPVPRLTNYPVLQKQPNDYTCVPTCIAMAMDMEVDTVIKHCEDLGIDLTNGMNDTVTRYVLMTLNIASYPFIAGDGVGILPGLFLASVPSRNFKGRTHSVLVHFSEGMIRVLDPNNERPNYLYWDEDSFGEIGISSFLRLDDFWELREELFKKAAKKFLT